MHSVSSFARFAVIGSGKTKALFTTRNWHVHSTFKKEQTNRKTVVSNLKCLSDGSFLDRHQLIGSDHLVYITSLGKLRSFFP